ncbi:hypothetical protein GQ600_25072 [Phytophthora cactorum]|nr:hypothetical protein GQ600_25072 [Phytophthora cactorum]
MATSFLSPKSSETDFMASYLSDLVMRFRWSKIANDTSATEMREHVERRIADKTSRALTPCLKRKANDKSSRSIRDYAVEVHGGVHYPFEIWRASSFQDLKSLAAMGGWMRIEMKRALIKHNYERPGLSQRELAAWAKVQFKLKTAPTQTTVSDILKL